MINLKHKTAFNYHETKGGVNRALKIGLDYARLPDAKTKDVFTKRLNGYGSPRGSTLHCTVPTKSPSTTST